MVAKQRPRRLFGDDTEPDGIAKGNAAGIMADLGEKKQLPEKPCLKN
jgi:hypothetical protein